MLSSSKEIKVEFSVKTDKPFKGSKDRQEDSIIERAIEIHTGRVNTIFFPMRIVLLIVGRFPFTPSVVGTEKDTGKNYTTSLKSAFWIYFWMTSISMVVMLILMTGGFLNVFLGWSFLSIQTWEIHHKAIFHSNLIPFVLVWSCLLHTCVGSISFFLNRKTVVNFLNFWNLAVDKLKMDIPQSLRRFVIMSNLWFFVFLVVTLISYQILSIQIVRGGSGLIGVLVLRIAFPEAHKEDVNFWYFRVVGLFIMMYSMYASRALLFLFAFKCRLLRHCFKEWNLRLYNELNQRKLDGFEDLHLQKASCTKLFEGHVILLRLVKLTDKSFAAILLSYYGSQILNMCFELYFLAMSGSLEIFSSDNSTGMDTFVAILLLIQNVYVFLTVSLHAAYVGEEANKGFDIVKTRGLRMDDNLYVRYLLQSLQISFQQRIQLTGGHYFAIDKPFIVTVLGAVFTYFIIILQYIPKISPVLEGNGTMSQETF